MMKMVILPGGSSGNKNKEKISKEKVKQDKKDLKDKERKVTEAKKAANKACPQSNSKGKTFIDEAYREEVPCSDAAGETTPISTTVTRPRAPALWSVNDSKLWFLRHCGDLGFQYSELFTKNNINGRALLKMNSLALARMGITNPAHREEIWRELIKLKLKSDVLEVRELESKVK